MNIEELRKAIEPGFDSKEVALELFKGIKLKGLKPRDKPCEDCAVLKGLYTALAACAFRHLTQDECKQLASTWDCHNGGLCKGAELVMVNNESINN